MSATQERIKRFADRYRITEYDAAKALNLHLKSPSLDKASERYHNEPVLSPERPKLLKELESWIQKELTAAKTGSDYRVIFNKTPEESELILEVIRSWDESIRTLILDDKHMPATKAREVLDGARPMSHEYFLARELFESRFNTDLARATRKRAVPLLFKLVSICHPTKRQELETLLLRFCRSRQNLEQLHPLLSKSEDRESVLKKLAKFKC